MGSASAVKIRTDVAMIDAILEPARPEIGEAYLGYRNHCYRVYNFCAAFAGEAGDSDKIAVAAAFHDLGIWTDQTFDYLAPSRRLVREYLILIKRPQWTEELEAMIEYHHRMRSYPGNPGWLVEPFRRADWVDVSLGMLSMGLPRSYIAEVRSALPNAGFHKTLVLLTARRMKKHPFSPLPMIKF